jgi:hypothetical protein
MLPLQAMSRSTTIRKVKTPSLSAFGATVIFRQSCGLMIFLNLTRLNPARLKSRFRAAQTVS